VSGGGGLIEMANRDKMEKYHYLKIDGDLTPFVPLSFKGEGEDKKNKKQKYRCITIRRQ
jgi:hypothetical protein